MRCLLDRYESCRSVKVINEDKIQVQGITNITALWGERFKKKRGLFEDGSKTRCEVRCSANGCGRRRCWYLYLMRFESIDSSRRVVMVIVIVNDTADRRELVQWANGEL